MKVSTIKVLLVSLLSTFVLVVPVQTASAITPVGAENGAVSFSIAGTGAVTTELEIASENATSTASAKLILMPGKVTAATQTASSEGLAVLNRTTITDQSATVALGGKLSMYTTSSTTVAISATGGTISETATATTNAPATDWTSSATAAAFIYNNTASSVAHTVGVIWTAPSTAGTYTITAKIANTATPGANPSATNPLLGSTIATVTVTVGGSHPVVGGTNAPDTLGTVDASMFVAVATNNGPTGVIHGASTATTEPGTGENAALSKGLLAKDTSFGTAQTATVLAGGVLSLYASVSTTTAITASGGSLSGSVGSPTTAPTATYSEDLRTTLFTGPSSTARKIVATLWTAPSAVGTYTVALYVGNGITTPTLSSPGVSLGAAITVTVVAASAGGAYSAPYSACNIAPAVAAITAGAGTAGIDNTVVFTNGDSAYINYDLNDGYNQNLAAGNVVITATGGALVNGGTSSIAAGTSSTDVEYEAPSSRSVRIDQGTSGAPVTTTVTITYNGTTVCTKTITIRGAVDKITVDQVGVQNTSGTYADTSAQWSYQNTGLWLTNGSLFRVRAVDSAGNAVRTDSGGTFASVASTLTVQVPALAVNTQATTNTASSMSSYAYGSWNCGVNAGETSVKVQWTQTSTGKVTTSDAFTARCAGSASGGSYKVSMDKAAYNLGDLAKVTVSFVDSKGNPVNTIGSVGANTWNLPYLTGVDLASGLGASAASTTAVTKADGTITYTLTVGTTSGLTAGTYTGIVDFSTPALGTKATPTYKLSTGSSEVSFTEVLKSVVALIASINKQIQALQKLILRR